MIEQRPLNELVAAGHFIVVGKVVSVTMVGEGGQRVDVLDADTGPGSPNTAYLNVMIDRKQVIKNLGGRVPKKIRLPIWGDLNGTLRIWRQAYEGKDFIFFLNKAADPVWGEDYERPIGELEAVVSMVVRPPSKARVPPPAKERGIK